MERLTFLGKSVQRLGPFRCLDGHVKEPYRKAWQPDRRSNFFVSPPTHLCAVAYITEISFNETLKLVRTPSNLELVRPPFFFHNIILSIHLYISDECRAWFHLYGTSRPARSTWKAKKKSKIKKKILAHSGIRTHNPEIWSLMLYKPKFENDEAARILSCKYSVLCYILKKKIIVQKVKRRISHVFAFNMQTKKS